MLEKNFKNGQQLTFDNGETKVLVNAKMFVDINKSIADMKIKFLGQDVRKKFLEKKKIICLVAAKLVKEHQVNLRDRFEKNLILELEKIKQSGMLNNYCLAKDCFIYLRVKTKY